MTLETKAPRRDLAALAAAWEASVDECTCIVMMFSSFHLTAGVAVDAKVPSATWWAARDQIADVWLVPASQDQRDDGIGRCPAGAQDCSAGGATEDGDWSAPRSLWKDQTPEQRIDRPPVFNIEEDGEEEEEEEEEDGNNKDSGHRCRPRRRRPARL